MPTFLPLLAAALALPLALWWATARRTSLALALTATTCGLVATGLGLWQMRDSSMIQTFQADGAVYRDTWYVIVHGAYLRNMGLTYLPIAAGLAAIAHLGPPITHRLALPAFAAFHLGASTTVLLTLAPPLAMPRRYADYPDWFRTMNQVSSLAAVLSFLSLAVLGFLLLVTLRHALHRRLL